MRRHAGGAAGCSTSPLGAPGWCRPTSPSATRVRSRSHKLPRGRPRRRTATAGGWQQRWQQAGGGGKPGAPLSGRRGRPRAHTPADSAAAAAVTAEPPPTRAAAPPATSTAARHHLPPPHQWQRQRRQGPRPTSSSPPHAHPAAGAGAAAVAVAAGDTHAFGTAAAVVEGGQLRQGGHTFPARARHTVSAATGTRQQVPGG